MQGKSLEETYNQFNRLYTNYKPNRLIQCFNVNGTEVRLYDIDNLAILLSRYPEKNSFNNLDLIGTEKLINKTIKKIKMNRFKLEEIIKK